MARLSDRQNSRQLNFIDQYRLLNERLAVDRHLIESHEKLRVERRPSVSSEGSLILGVVFGAVGLAYFVFGKRQQRFVPLFCGIGLMAFPYFISNTVLLVIVGLALSVIPYFLRL